MKALLIAALAIVGSSAAYADGTAGTSPANTHVTVAIATVTPETACTTNGLVASQGDGSLAYCKAHKWAAYQSSASTEHAIPAGSKKCSISGVVITGNADVRCAG